MNRAFLRNLGITDKETIDKILDLHSSDLGNIKKEIIKVKAKKEFLIKEKEKLLKQLKQKDEEIAAYTSSHDNQEKVKLQNELFELQKEARLKNETHAKEISDLKKKFKVESELINLKARNNKSVLALLDLEKIELNEDGTLKGLSEQIESLQNDESTKFLFNDGKPPILRGATLWK